MQDVACGIMIENSGDEVRILMGMRRDENNVWEFPGGKRNEGETLEECLKREWLEELNIDINVEKLIYTRIFNGYMCNFFIGTICDITTMYARVHDKVGLFSISAAKELPLFEGDEEVLDSLQIELSSNLLSSIKVQSIRQIS